jgi:heat shock protein HtpX
MISALRKIENRGELQGATSGVMEMCIDNPRGGFENLFDTHPAVDKRVEALVHYAGGHDPGPLAVPQFDAPAEQPEEPAQAQASEPTAAGGPWGPGSAGGRPFLPSRPPIDLNTPPPGSPGIGSSDPGPWGPQGGSR